MKNVNTETLLGIVCIVLAAGIIYLYITMSFWMDNRSDLSCKDLAQRNFKEMPAHCIQYISEGVRL